MVFTSSGSRPPPFYYPLHRITVILRHLRHSTWLTHLHHHHPHPQCRRHVDRLFRLIDRLQDYIRHHRLLPATVSPRSSTENHHHRLHHQNVELRRIHQHQLRESLTRIRQCIRPLQQYLIFHQPDQLTRYHQSMTILNIFTAHL